MKNFFIMLLMLVSVASFGQSKDVVDIAIGSKDHPSCSPFAMANDR